MTTDPAVVDILAAMLLRGTAPKLEVLLALSPDEPLMAVEPCDGAPPAGSRVIQTALGSFVVVPYEWPKRKVELARKYPGLQLDYWYREARKYAAAPKSPLSGQVRALLDTAKMHWSRAVEAYANGWRKHWGLSIDCTNNQFRDWLPEYMDQAGTRIAAGRWDEAAQIVRIACGLPRFAPTKPRKADSR
jgi:hypothetical protein